MFPQIIYLILVFFGLLLSAHRHGKPKKGTENFFEYSVAVVCGLTLLYWGGFFDVFFIN
jgi:hypothetical protein